MLDTSELIGFLTVIEHARFGLIGGYLVLNPAGRPVEFHCTTPVRATRTQEILYGSSLFPFLYGEQIGQTLLEKSRTPAGLLVTDSIPVLAVQEFIDQPIIYVARPKENEALRNDTMHGSLRAFGIEPNHEENRQESVGEAQVMQRLHAIPGLNVDRWQEIELGRRIVALPEHSAISRDQQREWLAVLMKTLDFLEPFERIRLAVEETQKAA